METVAAGTPQPHIVEAGRGLAWWTEAWALFRRSAGMWIVLALIMVIVFVVVGVIPVLGGLLTSLLMPVFAGGLMLAARKVDHGGVLEVGDLFAGFRDKLAPLLVLGALMLAAAVFFGIIAAAFGLGAAIGVFTGGASQSAAAILAALGAGIFGLLLILVLALLLAMAVWFAPTLVVLQGVAPVEAMKASFFASVKNTLPMLVYGVLYMVAAVVASIPFGLGWIVLFPVLLLTLYTSYRDVFES